MFSFAIFVVLYELHSTDIRLANDNPSGAKQIAERLVVRAVSLNG